MLSSWRTRQPDRSNSRPQPRAIISWPSPSGPVSIVAVSVICPPAHGPAASDYARPGPQRTSWLLAVQVLGIPVDHDRKQTGGSAKQQTDPCLLSHDLPFRKRPGRPKPAVQAGDTESPRPGDSVSPGLPRGWCQALEGEAFRRVIMTAGSSSRPSGPAAT